MVFEPTTSWGRLKTSWGVIKAAILGGIEGMIAAAIIWVVGAFVLALIAILLLAL